MNETAATPEPNDTPDASADEHVHDVRDPDAHDRSAEAAGYRRRLREAEATIAERDGTIATLQQQVDAMHRVEVERIADTRGMAAPADVWVAVQLSDLRDDDGNVDRDKVTSAVDGVLRERPHWRRPSRDLGAGAREAGDTKQAPGLSALLKR
jgi:hypothetical protein